MKTKLLALILIFTLTGFSFTQESTENPKSNIKTPEELQQEVLKNKNSKNDEFEECSLPVFAATCFGKHKRPGTGLVGSPSSD
jgi:hypothetical protein